jgi:outer membrane protein TolC
MMFKNGTETSDYTLLLVKANDNIFIFNKQLKMVIGSPDAALMIPDSGTLHMHFPVDGLDSFLQTAYSENHELKIAEIRNRVTETNIKFAGSDRYPVIIQYSGNNLQRSHTNNIPA